MEKFFKVILTSALLILFKFKKSFSKVFTFENRICFLRKVVKYPEVSLNLRKNDEDRGH